MSKKLFSKKKVRSLFPEPKREKIDSEYRIKILKFLFDAVITDPNAQRTRKKSIRIREISQKVPQWSYKFMYGFEQRARENEENVSEDRGIRSRRARRVLLFTDNLTNTDTYTNNNYSNNADQKEHVTLIRYLEQSDFRRGIIKGSMRAQRRKTVTYELFQANAHSPLFWTE